MKKYACLLALLAASCQKDADSLPENCEFEVQVLGRSRDCGLPQLEVLDDPAAVAALVGANSHWSQFVASNLDTALWVHQSSRLLVKVRKPLPSEVPVCLTYGPAYPPLTVVSARLKPSGH